MSTMFSMFYYFHARSIWILVLLLVKYSSYSNKRRNLEVWCILEGKRLLQGGAYFNTDTRKCGTY